jgi:hypothetical protein
MEYTLAVSHAGGAWVRETGTAPAGTTAEQMVDARLDFAIETRDDTINGIRVWLTSNADITTSADYDWIRPTEPEVPRRRAA